MTRGLALSFLSVMSVGFTLGCAPKSAKNVATTGRVGPTYEGPSETEYCSTPRSYSDSITVTGTARYIKRVPWGNLISGGMGSASLTGTHPAQAKPIRRAEVRVTDAAGSVIQCGETAGDGTFTLTLPRGSTNYTVYINSRANNSHVKASVLNRPEHNQFYSLSTSVEASVNRSVGTLTASADGDVMGAAFNILDRILDANEFLRTQAGSCASTFTDCSNFTVAPKVVAYWEKGFNPNSYFGGTSGLSFYLPDYSRLFVLGGSNGDVDRSDTDHFDDSVILHEYGHFLEDIVFASDSPGGAHDGNRIIDPRLAWSEGWGNFFQAAVRYANTETSPYYIDTLGNDDGDTDMIFYVQLESASVSNKDVPQASGEGNFREFSVTRLLWDIYDSNNDTANSTTESVSNRFKELWATLVKPTRGFRDPAFAFRNIGHMHLAQGWLQSNNNGINWSTARGVEWHDGDTSEYAQLVSTSGTCSYSITPTTYSGDTGDLSRSNLFYNNNFYHLKITSAGTYTLRLDYEDATSSGTEADLDLFLYNESARFAVSGDMIGYSRRDPDANAATAEYESVSASLAAGNYLINVNVYTGGPLGGTANYTLKLNGVELCPASIVAP